MDRGAWQAAIHKAAKSQTQPSDFQFHAYQSFFKIFLFQQLLWSSGSGKNNSILEELNEILDEDLLSRRVDEFNCTEMEK